MSHWLGVTLVLAGVYALTLGSADPLDLATGLVVGGLLAWALHHRLREEPQGARPRLWRRILWFPVFAGAVLADVIGGTWDVALRVLGLRPVDHAGTVRVPIGERTERGVAVSALTTTLSPGSYLVDLDWERREMILHLLDASDPEAVRARVQHLYDRYQRRVFP